MAGFFVVRLTKTQGVHGCDGPCAHCEHITQNTAHACRRALIRLDERRMVVAFHFEDDHIIITNIDHTGIFARPENHLWPFGRQGFQPFLG